MIAIYMIATTSGLFLQCIFGFLCGAHVKGSHCFLCGLDKRHKTLIQGNHDGVTVMVAAFRGMFIFWENIALKFKSPIGLTKFITNLYY